MAFPPGEATPPRLSPDHLTARPRPPSLSDRSELSSIEIPTTIPTTYQATDPSPPTTPTTNDHPLARRASVFSFSRLSFSALLTRLTSLHLPLTEELEQRIRAASTAAEMAAALMAAGKQISAWIETAAKVLRGLDAEDDVEWAAQGKESLTSVDAAVTGFEALMTVYIELIDDLHRRSDAETVPSEKLVELVGSMESTVGGWREVQRLLRGVKAQVETAMEWQELWDSILQDIQAELEACQTLVFELEEKRHHAGEEEDGIDIDALETIMEDRAPKSAEQIEDSSLLALFARMQPLRASLDFLPMRLSSFVGRANDVFPTACEELESRRKQMEKKWTRLSADAEGLKKELGEDRWVAIFRNAGKQAAAMLESIERSMNKLREAVIVWDETNGANDKDLRKKMESYEAKKMHYGAAIERTLSIIDKGLSDRFTLNGSILLLSRTIRTRHRNLQTALADVDQTLTDLRLNPQQLRESISSLSSSGLPTPGSSPASSVHEKHSPHNRTPNRNSSAPAPSSIPRSPYAQSGYFQPASTPPSGIPRSPYAQQPRRNSSSLSLYPPSTPRTSSAAGMRSASSLSSRPRWNGSTKTEPPPLPVALEPAIPSPTTPRSRIPMPMSPRTLFPPANKLTRQNSASRLRESYVAAEECGRGITRPGSVASVARPGSVASIARPGSVASMTRPGTVTSGGRRVSAGAVAQGGRRVSGGSMRAPMPTSATMSSPSQARSLRSPSGMAKRPSLSGATSIADFTRAPRTSSGMSRRLSAFSAVEEEKEKPKPKWR